MNRLEIMALFQSAFRVTITLPIVACTCILAGCELFVIGGPSLPAKPVPGRTSAQGVVLYLKTELDSANALAAAEVLSTESKPMLAIERLNYQASLERLGRVLNRLEVTSLKTDTVSATKHNVLMQVGYHQNYRFSTVKIGTKWYVAEIEKHLERFPFYD